MYLIPWFQFTVFHLGPVPLRVWGLFVALGMVVAVWIIWRRAANKKAAETMVDLAVWVIIAGLLGARLVHVLFYEPAFYLTNPVEIFKVWHGGLSSFGGLFGAVVGFFVYLKIKQSSLRIEVNKMLKFADALVFASVYGWMVGRLGCVMIHDHPGIPCNCFLALPWPDGTPRFDMAMLEILGMIPLAIWFFMVRKKQEVAGWYLHVLFIYYGALRFILDFFRATDLPGADARYFGLTPAQYFAIVLVVVGARFFFSLKRHTGRIA